MAKIWRTSSRHGVTAVAELGAMSFMRISKLAVIVTAPSLAASSLSFGEGCLGDLSVDGVVDGADLGRLLYDWGSRGAGSDGAPPADLNGDGEVSGPDLAMLLENWGSCLPLVLAIEPSIGASEGGTQVTITGQNLDCASSVLFGGRPASHVTVISASQVSAISPIGEGGTLADVSVSTCSGTSALARAFEYLPCEQQICCYSGNWIIVRNSELDRRSCIGLYTNHQTCPIRVFVGNPSGASLELAQLIVEVSVDGGHSWRTISPGDADDSVLIWPFVQFGSDVQFTVRPDLAPSEAFSSPGEWTFTLVNAIPGTAFYSFTVVTSND